MFWSFIGKLLLDILAGLIVDFVVTEVLKLIARYRQAQTQASFA